MHVTITFDLQPNGVRSDFTMLQEICRIVKDIADSIYCDEKGGGSIYDCMGTVIGSYMAMEVGDE